MLKTRNNHAAANSTRPAGQFAADMRFLGRGPGEPFLPKKGSPGIPPEKGSIRKPRGIGLPVALVYPNAYRIGMANLGFQFLYAHLNANPRFVVERFFFSYMPTHGARTVRALVSEESARPLSQFPLIAFSIPFENDYPAIPGALMAAGIPPFQKDRASADPVVIAGGIAVSLNPEPLAEFLDLVFVGEIDDKPDPAPDAFFSLLADLLLSSETAGRDREELLKHFRDVPAVYVPSAYAFDFKPDGLIRAIKPQPGFPSRVSAGKRTSKDAPVPVSVLFTPEAEFGDSLLVEAGRGCGRGCRFCAAGWTLLPSRHAGFARFREAVAESIAQGRTIGLIGSDLASHPELEGVLRFIVQQGGKFSLSSIRPEGLTPSVIELLAQTGQKTATLAPEVASRRMKKIIGKDICSEKFYELVESLVSAGIPNVRFYFMIGLPGETDDDVREIVDFARHSRKIFVNASRRSRRIGKIGLQINPFVPKPWTPFQWAPTALPDVLERRIAILRDGLKKEPNLVLRVESPRTALFEAVLSRGDRRLAPGLVRLAQQGGQWSAAFKKEGIDPAFYAFRERGENEIFPWDVVDHGVSKNTSWKVFRQAWVARE